MFDLRLTSNVHPHRLRLFRLNFELAVNLVENLALDPESACYREAARMPRLVLLAGSGVTRSLRMTLK